MPQMMPINWIFSFFFFILIFILFNILNYYIINMNNFKKKNNRFLISPLSKKIYWKW